MGKEELVLKVLKNVKVAGTDIIIGEFHKYGEETARGVIYNICKEVLEECYIKLIYKGGGKDKADIGNCRLTAIMFGIYS